MDVVQVHKIHTDPTVIYNIRGKLDHVTYITAATQNFSYFILITCIVFLCITALMTLSQSFFLPSLKIETN